MGNCITSKAMANDASKEPHDVGTADTTTRDSETIPQKRARNAKRCVNELPPEVLSRIFVIGEETERSTRQRKNWYIGFQDLATQVCSHWRDVAINTLSLWTYIHITRPGPHNLACLYLIRAGPATLLDINLEMCGRFYDSSGIWSNNWRRQVDKAVSLLKFFVTHGADVHRWRSLTICAQHPQVLYRIIGFLNARPAPTLRFLSCTWKKSQPNRGYTEEMRSLSYPYLFSDSYSFAGSSMPVLRCIEFTSVPWDYVFGRSSPLFTGLTSLSLTAGQSPICALSKLVDLLRANPQLESLTVNTGETHDVNDFETMTEHVQLACLDSLSVCTTTHIHWALGVVQMIRAPALQNLTLVSLVITDDENMELLQSSFATNPSGHMATSSSLRPNETPYPLLNKLDVSKLSCTDNQLIDMLLSLPSVTELAAGSHQTALLGKEPWVLPKLNHLKLSRGASSSPSLGDILHRREQKGFPVKVLELKDFENAPRELPSIVQIYRHHS